MTDRNWHRKWMEQCEAAETIKLRYGLKAAFDYVIAEKLLHFAEAAARHPEFARELPRFVSRVRQIFTAQELLAHLARIERERHDNELAAIEDDDLDFETPAATAERARQFDTIKELLTANRARHVVTERSQAATGIVNPGGSGRPRRACDVPQCR